MKWAAVILAVVLYLVWPYYTLIVLAQAIQSKDAETINQTVDWVSVRTSFKAQMQSHLESMPKTASEQKNPKLAAVGNAFALTMANSLIDKVLTPEGIARLLQVSSAQDSQQNTASEIKADPQQRPKNDLFERIKFAFFISPIHFQLDLRAPNNKQAPTDDQAVTVMLAFKGNGWQVTDLRLPRGGLAPKTAQAAAN